MQLFEIVFLQVEVLNGEVKQCRMPKKGCKGLYNLNEFETSKEVRYILLLFCRWTGILFNMSACNRFSFFL